MATNRKKLPKQQKPEKYWTVEELWQPLGFKSKLALYGLIERGNFPCVRFGRKILVPQSLLDRYIEQQNSEFLNAAQTINS